MDIFYNKKANNPVMKVYQDDIDFYAKQLLTLVHLYRKHIYLKTDRDVAILNELEYYGKQLANHAYQTIITNAEEIISTEEFEVPF